MKTGVKTRTKKNTVTAKPRICNSILWRLVRCEAVCCSICAAKIHKIWLSAKKTIPLRAFAIVYLLKSNVFMKENNFVHHISKDLIHWFPRAEFPGEVIVVDSHDLVSEAMAYLKMQKIVGVDTETRPSFVRGVHHPTALLQIATEQKCYLFRLTKIGFPHSLAYFFSNKRICKVGLAFKDDINGLRKLRDFIPGNCIDIQKIVPNYGIFDLGLQNIFAICFGKKISKSQQLTNWENDNLTPYQARYASTDAWATLLIYKELRKTKPLSEEQVEELRKYYIEQQKLHQQQVLAQRKNNES
jgi:hypothetical protein